jgi:hypothetical protein
MPVHHQCSWGEAVATLYGIPESKDKELHTKNRTAWNRFMATQLNIKARDALELKGFPADELNPLSPQELTAIEEAFRYRRTQGGDIQFPQIEKVIDFSNVRFHRFEAEGFLFAIDATFFGATFNGFWTLFNRATFNGTASFEQATFDCSAYFGGRSLTTGPPSTARLSVTFTSMARSLDTVVSPSAARPSSTRLTSVPQPSTVRPPSTARHSPRFISTD